MLLTPQGSELALRRRRVQFPPEGLSHRSKDDGHVLGGYSGLVAADVPLAGIDIALTFRDYLWRASRIVSLIERDLAFNDGDEDRPWMGMPTGRTPRRVVMGPHDNVGRTLRLE